MPRTLFRTSNFTRISVPLCAVPLYRSFSQSIVTGRAIYSRSGTTTKTAPPNLKDQLTAYLQDQNQTTQKQKSKSTQRNMSFLLPGLRRTLLLTTPLILSAPLLLQQRTLFRPLRCDGPDPLTKITRDLSSNYTSEARTPILTESGTANPRAIRQVSMGSILGVFCGLGISVFSKPLAVLIGLGIVALQVRLCHGRIERGWVGGG
jgi:hypothetical protein